MCLGARSCDRRFRLGLQFRLAPSATGTGDRLLECDRPEDDKLEVVREAVREWLARNWNVVEFGGTGDVYDLLVTVNAAWMKAVISSSDTLNTR